MMYRLSAVVAIIIATLSVSFAQTFTPPNGEEKGITTTGIIFVHAPRIDETKPSMSPIEVRSDQMVDGENNWITGIKMSRSGDYFIYNTGLTLDVGDEVLVCFVLGKNFYMPACYFNPKYRPLGKKWIKNWYEEIASSGAIHNFHLRAIAPN